MEIPRRYDRLQAELERPLHRDSCKSPSSTRTDPAHPTCSYTEMQGNPFQSARPSALGIRIYCMEHPHCQEHQAPRRHPKQCSMICTSQIRLEHQCYSPQSRPQLAYTSKTPQNPWPHHVLQDTLRPCKHKFPVCRPPPSAKFPRPTLPWVVLYPGSTQSGLLRTHILCPNHSSLELLPCITSQRYFAELLPASGSDPLWVAPTLTPPYPYTNIAPYFFLTLYSPSPLHHHSLYQHSILLFSSSFSLLCAIVHPSSSLVI